MADGTQTNLRQDDYGGSIESRVRFALEVVDAANANWSADHVGVRIFPADRINGIDTADDLNQHTLHLVREIDHRNEHVSEPDWTGGQPFTENFRATPRRAAPRCVQASAAPSLAPAATRRNGPRS